MPTVINVYSYLITILGLLIVGFFVLLNNKKKITNQIFFLLVLSIVLWILCLLVADNSQNINVVEAASRVAFSASALVFLFLLFFSQVFPSAKSRLKIGQMVLFALPTALFVISSISKYSVESVTIQSYGADVKGGIIYQLFFAYIATYFILAVSNIYRNYKKASSKQRIQFQYLIAGIIIAGTISIITNVILVIFGISSLGFLGPPSLLIFVLLTAVAIVRHKLFDIRAAVARTVTYISVISTLAIIYGFVVFRLSDLIFPGDILTTAEQFFNIILAVILAFTFQPLKRFFERVTDRIFFRDKYDSQEVLNNISRILASEIQLNKLSTEITKAITTQMKISKADIVVVDGDEIFYQTRIIHGPHHDLSLQELKKLTKSIAVSDELAGGERKEIMTSYGVSVSLALRTHEQFLGFLLLGEKLSGDIYSSADIKLLRIIADELAIAIQNAKSYAEIQRFNETLQVKIAWATQKLRNANTDLKELDKAKDEFISMASHQLRTPLTTTKGYVSMVLDGDFGKLSPKQLEPLQQALDSANRMAGLVSDLLNVSRMDAGKFFIDAHPIDLAGIVQSEINGLKSFAQSKNIHLSYIGPDRTLPMMNLDEEKTRQVIMNLIDNAIHYGAPKSGPGEVKVSLQKENNHVVFKVVDNGIGVPESMKDKLFTKFYRAANAQAARPDGTGLGLYLVKRVVEDQGGEIIFDSTEGKGSTFGFRFPLKTKFKPGVTKARVPITA